MRLDQSYLHRSHSSVRKTYQDQDHLNNNKTEKKRKFRKEFFEFSCKK